jgi:hypothetical protein
MTTIAAAEVVAILLAANLRPAHTFRVTGLYPPGPPITFTFSVTLSALVRSQIATIPDIAIERPAAD